jgi:hypothetical protein
MLLLAAGSSSVAGAAQASGGCTGRPASAIDQYCELVPTPTGGQPPRSRDVKLGGTLPRRLQRTLLRHPSELRALGGLPARLFSPRHPAGPSGLSRAPVQDAGVSWWSITTPIVILLAAAGLGLAGWAGVEHRRRPRRDGGPDPHGSPR